MRKSITERRKTMSLTLPGSLIESIKQKAGKQDVSSSFYVTKVMRAHFADGHDSNSQNSKQKTAS